MADMADHYLRKRYYEEVVSTLMTDFAFANVMQAPKHSEGCCECGSR